MRRHFTEMSPSSMEIVSSVVTRAFVDQDIYITGAGRGERVLLPGLCLSLLTVILFQVTAAFAAPEEHIDISSWEGTATCLRCHETEAQQVFESVHYQWLGKTPYLVGDGPEVQGKLDVGVNSYCINIKGNWSGCGSCHVGLGARPTKVMTREQLENIDCLICHQQGYKRTKVNGVFVPDLPKMNMTMLEAAQMVHKPNRVTCLQCHAKGGGGDNFKRGDLALAHGTTADDSFDVHMATTGGNLSCQGCHTTENHLMAGRGTDLRPTELDVEMNCTVCHEGKDSTSGHGDSAIGRHVSRVACQTCHIPTYARNATDTSASEETEIDRDWRFPHLTSSGAIHPTPVMAGEIVPRYGWWDGRSSTYLLYDDAVIDQKTGAIPTSRPVGDISGSSKIYPFKYKTATQPLASSFNQLIALDTSVYFSSGNVGAAVESGLENMGYQANEPYEWVQTDTFQLITHEVSPASEALRCNDCHADSVRIALKRDLGYGLKGSRSEVCLQCHGVKDGEDEPEYLWIHEEHVEEESYDCSWCHTFNRPERSLTLPPIIAKIANAIRTLRVVIGLPLLDGPEDQSGDGRVGLEEAVHYLRDAAGN